MIAPALAEFRRWRPLLDGLAGEVHPERWLRAGGGQEAMRKLTANSRSRRSLSLRLDWLGGKPVADGAAFREWQEWKDADPLALAPGNVLWEAGLRLGAGLFRDVATRLVLGRDVSELKAGIGVDAYQFALRQAGLIRELGRLSPDCVVAETLSASIRQAAVFALSTWLWAMPASLAERVVLKLPLEIDTVWRGNPVLPAGQCDDWRKALIRILSLKQV